MFGAKKKQRSALPEKQQLTKYYEMDGALRAYANRMALLGMTCRVFALGTLVLFAYPNLRSCDEFSGETGQIAEIKPSPSIRHFQKRL